MKLLNTTQLAAKLKVSGACIRQWKSEGRIAPVFEAPSGEAFYAPATKKPKPLKPGPKRAE